jgi:Rrf2 family iron-sulfur cluster assembly transcriptional regulator
MILLCRRSILALAAVADIAIHARPQPVAAKTLAGRLDLPPRHLETLLQALVRADILKGVRGPHGGYELARERRRISAAEVIRAVMNGEGGTKAESRFVENVISPIIEHAGEAFLGELELVSIDDICRQAGEKKIFLDESAKPDFTI